MTNLYWATRFMAVLCLVGIQASGNAEMLTTITQQTIPIDTVTISSPNHEKYSNAIDQAKKTLQQQLHDWKMLSVSQLTQQNLVTPPKRITLPTRYPIRSHCLTPGQVKPKRLPVPFTPPMVWLGTDSLSQQWLAQHAFLLQAHHLPIFVIDADSKQAVEQLKALCPNCSLLPMPGIDRIACRLKIFHYPLWFTPNGIAS